MTWLERLAKPSPTNAAPEPGEMRRNDLLVAALLLFAIFLAFGIRNQVLDASKSVQPGGDLPRIDYPASWRMQTPAQEPAADGLLLQAINPGSPSTFDSRLLVTTRALRTDETLEDGRVGRAIKLAGSLPSFRELEAERMTVYNTQPALVSTYAYVADPTQDAAAGGLPVVVEAQDIMFLDNGQFVVVTLAADATEWEAQQRDFAIVTNSLRLQPLPEQDLLDQASPTAPAAPGAANDNSGSSGLQTGEEQGADGATDGFGADDAQTEGGN